jgi:hypothetical protein
VSDKVGLKINSLELIARYAARATPEMIAFLATNGPDGSRSEESVKRQSTFADLTFLRSEALKLNTATWKEGLMDSFEDWSGFLIRRFNFLNAHNGPCDQTTPWGRFILWFAKGPTTGGRGNNKTAKAVLLGHVALYLYIKYLPIAVQCHLRSLMEQGPALETELEKAIESLKETKKELTGLQTRYKTEIAPYINID